MPRPPRPWYRSYSEELDNQKTFALGTARPDLYFAWRLLLDLANIGTPRGHLPQSIEDIAFALRQSPQKAAEIVGELQHLKFIDLKGKRLYMHKWHEWNPDSDANLTPARAKRNSRTPKERVKNGERTPKERIEEDREEEKEQDKEKEEEQIARDAARVVPFVSQTAEPFPEPPGESRFATTYRQRHEAATMKPIYGDKLPWAKRVETEYGYDLCVEAAEAKGWDKHPKYYVGLLEDLRNGLNIPARTNNGTNGAGRYDAAESALPAANGAYLHAIGFGSKYVEPSRDRLGEEGVGEEAVAVGVEAP